jgi:hypothetical protein
MAAINACQHRQCRPPVQNAARRGLACSRAGRRYAVLLCDYAYGRKQIPA